MFGPFVFGPLLLVVSLYALWRGGPDERIVAATCCLATLATYFAIAPLRERYASVEEGLILVDGLTLLVFVLVALKSDRFWPLWVAGLQLTTSIGHVLKGIDQDLLPRAYGAALTFWGYPILLILAVGTFRNRHRLKQAQA